MQKYQKFYTDTNGQALFLQKKWPFVKYPKNYIVVENMNYRFDL